jgi:hypothetical protein
MIFGESVGKYFIDKDLVVWTVFHALRGESTVYRLNLTTHYYEHDAAHRRPVSDPLPEDWREVQIQFQIK